MQYRKMSRSTDRISSLGLGCMRLPTLPDGKIDETSALDMMHYAYKHGVNYFDTAWPYHSEASEPLLGKFLSQVDRKKVLVATKMPCWLVKTQEDMQKYLDEQLQRLQTNYIDYYLLHALGKTSWKKMKDLGVWDFLHEAKASGKIRHIGFSFHDDYPTFKKIVNAYDWDFCQIMLNYLDTHYQAGINGYKLAVSKGMGVIAMEPLRGGKLISPIPEQVDKLWKKGNYQPLERALSWIWNLSGCTVLLSGMSTMEQLKENIAYADVCKADQLSETELKLYAKVRREYIKRIPIRCTECRYCLPCPSKVAIPYILGIYNEAMMFDNKARLREEYKAFINDENKADKCTNCGACLPKCPQHIDIPSELKKIAEFFN